jgi:membrane-associated phospholipid phosphatase
MIVAMRDNLKRAGLISAGVFGVLFLLVILRVGFIDGIDKAITSGFGGLQSPIGDALMFIITQIGSPLMSFVYALVLAVILWLSDLRIPAAWVLATFISGAVIVETILKNIVGRVRPIGHQSVDSGYSFPSGHMVAFSIIVVMLFILVIPNMAENNIRQWLSWALITFGALVAESRLYLQAHYLTDVVAGAALGIAWVTLWVWLYQRYAVQLRRLSIFANDEV